MKRVLITASTILVHIWALWPFVAVAETKVGGVWVFQDLELQVESVTRTGVTQYTSPVLFGAPPAKITGTSVRAYVTISPQGSYADTAGFEVERSGESILVIKAKMRGALKIAEKAGDVELLAAEGHRLKPLFAVEKQGSNVGEGDWIVGDYPFVLPADVNEVEIKVRGERPVRVRLSE